MNCNIYYLTDDIGEPRYVGKTIKTLETRLKNHLATTKKYKSYKNNWINKVGKNQIEINLIEICDNINSNEREIYWISYFKYLGFKLTNCTDGGDGGTGKKHSEETKQKISNTKKNNITDDYRKKLSECHKGIRMSAKSKDKLSKRMIGNKYWLEKHTEETKQKISKAKLGKLSYIPNDETKKKISESLKGNIPVNKGKPMSEEQKLKLKEAWKSRRIYKVCTEETRKKISESMKGNTYRKDYLNKNKI